MNQAGVYETRGLPEQWAAETMLETLSRVAASGGAARARIKIDRPHPVKSKLDQLGMLK